MMSEQSLSEGDPHQGKCHGDDETERLKQVLTSWGMLVSDLGGGNEKRGMLMNLQPEYLHETAKLPDNCDQKRKDIVEYKIDH